MSENCCLLGEDLCVCEGLLYTFYKLFTSSQLVKILSYVGYAHTMSAFSPAYCIVLDVQ